MAMQPSYPLIRVRRFIPKPLTLALTLPNPYPNPNPGPTLP